MSTKMLSKAGKVSDERFFILSKADEIIRYRSKKFYPDSKARINRHTR